MIELFTDFWKYIRVRKKYWLIPILIILLLLSLIVLFGQTSPVSPFVYPLL